MSSLYVEKERELVRGQLWRLAPEAQDRWTACRSSHRFMAYKGKQLVLFTFDAEQSPKVTDRLVLSAANLSLSEGIQTTWQSEISGQTISVGSLPVEIAENVFLWTAYSSDVQFIPHKGVYGIRLPLIFQSRHNISHPTLNDVYIMELAAFEAEFCE